MSKYFEKALGNMVRDVSSGDAIRHLADQGMNVYEISEQLTFPTPLTTIRDVVWKYYLDTGIISIEDPSTRKCVEVTYVEDYDKFGRKSYRRVEKKLEIDKRKYVKVDFGKSIYADKMAFEDAIAGLEQSDRDYILSLPWPISEVWHVQNDRMDRIMNNMKLCKPLL